MKYLFFNNNLIASCRPKQWTKNLLVFSAPIFSFKYDPDIWISAFVTFIVFCLLSSSIYLINDVLDIKSDKKHHKKKNRPIASGLTSKKEALSFSFFLLLISFLISFSVNLNIVLIITIYLIIQILYCIKLKKKPIVDIFCISAGFLLRAISGALSAKLEISPWFLLSVALLALFLAIEKRKAELRISINKGIVTREVLKYYSINLLSKYENIVATSSFVSYSLWAAGPSLNGASTSWMLLTVPLVLIGIFRYQLLSENKIQNNENFIIIKSENPEDILLQDKGIRLILITWLLVTVSIGIFVLP